MTVAYSLNRVCSQGESFSKCCIFGQIERFGTERIRALQFGHKNEAPPSPYLWKSARNPEVEAGGCGQRRLQRHPLIALGRPGLPVQPRFSAKSVSRRSHSPRESRGLRRDALIGVDRRQGMDSAGSPAAPGKPGHDPASPARRPVQRSGLGVGFDGDPQRHRAVAATERSQQRIEQKSAPHQRVRGRNVWS
jgi:hypothetical protein